MSVRRPGEALVFEHEAKPAEPICGISLYRRFVSAAKRADLPVLRFHEYADVVVMPMSGRSALPAGLIAA